MFKRFTDLRVSSEGPEVDLPSRHGSDGVYHNGHPGLLVLLIQHLSPHINAREPAAIARVAVVPAQGILQTTHLRQRDKSNMCL